MSSPAGTLGGTRATASSSAMTSVTRSPASSSRSTTTCSPERPEMAKGNPTRAGAGFFLSHRLQSPPPPLYFGGSSDAGIDVAVDTVDKYLTWGEPPAQVAEKIAKVRDVAAGG